MRAGGSRGDRAVERRRSRSVSGDPAAGCLMAAGGACSGAAARVRARGHRQEASALSPGHRLVASQRRLLGDQCGLTPLAQRGTDRSARRHREGPPPRRASAGSRWLGRPPRRPLPPLRIVLVLDNLAGHLSYDLVRWFFDHGVMPLYTPIGGSWLNMAESVQRIIVPRALAGHHPKNAQEVIDWLEQTVAGWNRKPTPFIWNGKRRRRRERARLRRLAGSGAALAKGYSLAS